MKRSCFLTVTTIFLTLILAAGLALAQNVKTYMDQGIENCEKGHYDQAIKDFNQALKLKPNDAAIITFRGVAKYAKGQLDQALADFEQAIKLNANHGKAYYQRGMIYENRQQYGKAVEDIKKAKSLGYHVETDWIKNLERKAAAEKK